MLSEVLKEKQRKEMSSNHATTESVERDGDDMNPYRKASKVISIKVLENMFFHQARAGAGATGQKWRFKSTL